MENYMVGYLVTMVTKASFEVGSSDNKTKTF